MSNHREPKPEFFTDPVLFEMTRDVLSRSQYKPRDGEAIDWSRPLYDTDGNPHRLVDLGGAQVVTAYGFVRLVFNRKTAECIHEDDMEGKPLRLCNEQPDPQVIAMRRQQALSEALYKDQVMQGGFHGIKHLYKDGQGYVYWKSRSIENFSHSDPFSEREDAIRLAAQCHFLESQDQAVNATTIGRLHQRLRTAEDMPSPKFLVNFSLISHELPIPPGAHVVDTTDARVRGTLPPVWFDIKPLSGNASAMAKAQREHFPGNVQPAALRSMIVATREDLDNVFAGVQSDVHWLSRVHGAFEVETPNGTSVKIPVPDVADTKGYTQFIIDHVAQRFALNDLRSQLPRKSEVENALMGKHIRDVQDESDAFYAKDLSSCLAMEACKLMKLGGGYQSGTYQTLLNEIENPSMMSSQTVEMLEGLSESMRESDGSLPQNDKLRALVQEAERLIDLERFASQQLAMRGQ